MAGRSAFHIPPTTSDEPRAAIWLQLLYRYGFPAAVAAFLLYFVTQVLASDVKQVVETANATRVSLDQHNAAMNAASDRDAIDRQRLSRQLHGLCMVVAEGDPISERWCEVGQ